MFLKDYQIKVVNELKRFFESSHRMKKEIEDARKSLPENLRKSIPMDWVKLVFSELNKPYLDESVNGLGEPYPRVCLKIPTGGGKTLLAVEAIREYQNLFIRRRTGLICWVVPSETIYTQTIEKLRDKGNFLRQLLDQCSGGNTLILEKGQRLSQNDLETNLVILMVMDKSVNRKGVARERLIAFKDSGGYESFFPKENRYDLHKQFLQQIPNLDTIGDLDSAFSQIKTSLGNAIRVTNPLIIIDEIHKVFSEQARGIINSLNPSMVLGLSATPRMKEMNILVEVSGLELKNAEMVKLDMHIIEPRGRKNDDWRTMLREIKEHREKLEKKARLLGKQKPIYIRPIALIQVEATGKEQRGKGRVHSLDVREYLIEIGINPDHIAIKTSSQNDIEDVNLFSNKVQFRYLITKEALREGWDCSFAYILGIIPNVNSGTGVTQLVGRILRQPNAKKLNIKELDESYIYYSKGQVQKILAQVEAGFIKEGLEGLLSNVKIMGINSIHQRKIVQIKNEFRKKFANSFYLPVWLAIQENGKKRKFNYDIDVKPHLEFGSVKLDKTFITELNNSLSNENRDRRVFTVTLNDESKMKQATDFEKIEENSDININYFTRRVTDIIENAFLARQKVDEYIEELLKGIGEIQLKTHFGFIVSQIVEMFIKIKLKQEEDIFDKLNSSRKIVLAVSDSEQIGYCIPEKDEIIVGREENYYKYYLYDDADIRSMNNLEKEVGNILDSQDKILWWFKNKVRKDWFSVQGWRKGKIYPDFIAAKKNNKGGLDLVYVIESKGEHLEGNKDTIYKNSVFQKMNKVNVNVYQTELEFDQVKDKVQFYLIQEGEEEKKVKELYK